MPSKRYGIGLTGGRRIKEKKGGPMASRTKKANGTFTPLDNVYNL